MRVRGAIFDMDGTLLDSMPLWENVGAKYLRSQGVEPPDDLREQLRGVSMAELSGYFRAHFGLQRTTRQIIDGIYALIDGGYRYQVQLKPGVPELLHALRRQGARLCVATATDRPMVELALGRLAVLPLFDFILTCSEVNANKNSPLIFEKCLARLGVARQETIVFEDAWHAVRTAKLAGFPVAAVADPSAGDRAAAIRALADWYIEDYRAFSLANLTGGT